MPLTLKKWHTVSHSHEKKTVGYINKKFSTLNFISFRYTFTLIALSLPHPPLEKCPTPPSTRLGHSCSQILSATSTIGPLCLLATTYAYRTYSCPPSITATTLHQASSCTTTVANSLTLNLLSTTTQIGTQSPTLAQYLSIETSIAWCRAAKLPLPTISSIIPLS